MPNEPISESVLLLQARRRAIEKEIAELDSRLRAIWEVVSAEDPAPKPNGSPVPFNDGGGRPTPERGSKPNRWFAPGEALTLMRRQVRTPMRPAEIVQMLTRAKGVDGTLSALQWKRFQGTAYMAVANAIKRGAATKLKDGRVRMA
jgi:hypothetical protein